MKKVIIIGLICILFSIAFILYFSTKNVTTQQEKNRTTPAPSFFNIGNERNGAAQTGQNTIVANENAIIKNSEEGTLPSNFNILPKNDIKLLEELKKILPYKTGDFEVYFSPSFGSFIVIKKTPAAMEKFKAWSQEKGIPQLIENKNLFIIKEQSGDPQSSLSGFGSGEGTGGEKNKFAEFITEFFRVLLGSTPGESTSTPTLPTSSPSVPGPSVSGNLAELFTEVGQKVGVPPRIIEGVMMIEDPSVFSLSQQEIAQYTTPGNTIPGCKPNQCSASGPMQMTIGTDGNGSSSCSGCCWNGRCLSSCPNAWLSYGGSVNTYGGYSYASNPCNLKDNVYAAAAKLKSDSGATSASSWTQEQVYKAGKSYYGNCTAAYSRLGNRTYCEYLWWYYTNSAGVGSGTDNSGSTSYKGNTYYSQCGDPYGNLALPGGCTLCRAGCGPTTASMILSSKVDASYTPQKLIDLYKQNGYQLDCDGSYYLNAKSIIEQYGVQTSDLIFYSPTPVSGSKIINDVKSYVQAGWTIFALANFGCSTGQCGHFFWIVDVDSQNNILAFDPFYGRFEIPYNESARDPSYKLGFGVR